MAPIVASVEIARSPEEVFAYLDELERHGEWQDAIVSTRLETEGPTRKGSRAVDTRKMPGGRQQDFTYEITEHDPPRRTAFRVLNGPIRPVGKVTVEPSGSGSRVTLESEFKGHGIGKLLLPLVVRDARKRIPADQQRLKERVESGV
jgi:uncharacterized protein YndB with AHSA1/START domain